MKRESKDIQSVEQAIMQMRKEGRTRQETANALGLENTHTKDWIWRYNSKQGKALELPRKDGHASGYWQHRREMTV